MKEHRKPLHRKRRLLLPRKKWTTGLCVFRKLCFPQWHCLQLNEKKQSIFQHQGYSSILRRRKTFKRCKANQTDLHLKKLRFLAYREKVHRLRKLLKLAAQRLFKDVTEDKYLEAIEKEGCWASKGINGKTVLSKVIDADSQSAFSHADGDAWVTKLPINKESLPPNWEVKHRHVLVVLNGKKKSRAKVRDRVLEPTRKTRSPFFHCGKKRFPLFMMYRKLSIFSFRCRFLQSSFRARNKTLKVKKFNRSFFQKLARFLGKNRRRREGGVCNLFPHLTTKNSPIVRRLHSSSDMNSNISRLLRETKECIPDGYPGTESVKLRSSHRQCEETVPKRHDVHNGQLSPNSTSEWECTESLATEIDVAPVVNNCITDIFVLVTDKDDSISCGNENMVEFNKGDSITNDHVSTSEPLLKENMGNSDSSCQMEVDESTDTDSDVFSTKFDHLYCKRPHEDPSSEDTSVASERQEGNMQLETQEGVLQLEKQEGGVKNGQKMASLVPDQELAAHICGFLSEIMKKYGSLIPLSEKDVLASLKEVFNEDFSNRKSFVTKEISKFRSKHSKGVLCNFRVFYNKHMLDMDDLATLDGQNWLNDQVINMYGELIMDAVPDKVHFFNSFFHRQLVTKGYNGVKRWTKKVDLFKKTLLLIPIHLEVHWSLITVNLPNRIISFYDSQGIHFKFCVENIRKYLLTEAREKNNPEFLQGWQTAAVTKYIPQQKNDSDCGVFVLQYCKCLALEQPFQFSQDDMPRVRKRIYKELCECRLMD